MRPGSDDHTDELAHKTMLAAINELITKATDAVAVPDGLEDVALQLLLDTVAEHASRGVVDTAAHHARHLAMQRQETSDAIREVWGDALDLYDVVREAALSLGSEINTTDRPAAAEAHSSTFEVLVNLHARACRISAEIGTLLRSGHGTGALSLWRSIHELAIVARLVDEGGDDLARRYLDFNAISAYDDLVEYNKHAPRLGMATVPNDELDRAKELRDEAAARHEPGFAKPLGWAKELHSNPSWKQLEILAELDHLRPFYSLASHAIHATPRGGDLSYVELSDGTVALAVGTTTEGLAEPASAAALSLTQITTILLASTAVADPQPDRLAAAKALKLLTDDLDERLSAAHLAHEARVAAARTTPTNERPSQAPSDE